MPMRLVDPEKGIPWAHPDERKDDGTPVEGATVFHIKPLTEAQSRKLSAAKPAMRSAGDGVTIDTGSFHQELFLSNVIKIDNVLWPGATAPVTITEASDLKRFLECVPAAYMGPVYAAIQNISQLDEGQVKN